MDFLTRLQLVWPVNCRHPSQTDQYGRKMVTTYAVSGDGSVNPLPQAEALYVTIQEESLTLALPIVDYYDRVEEDFVFVKVEGPITPIKLLEVVHDFYRQPMTQEDKERVISRSNAHGDDYEVRIEAQSEEPILWRDIRCTTIVDGFTEWTPGVFIVEISG